LRDEYSKVQELGGEVVVVGTGNPDLAQAFVEDDEIPFPVLIDDAAGAARAAAIKRVWFHQLFHPDSYSATIQAWKDGHRIGKPGKRTNQLGATFVIGPGNVINYEFRDAHSADHAPMGDVFAALRGAA
jgi:peroxiredoxin